MPGRQAHGRSLMGGGGAAGKNKQGKNRSKSRAQKAALNAFSIAEDQFADRQKRTPRNRELDAQIQSSRGKRSRDDADEDDDEDGEGFGDDDDDDDANDGPPRKMRRGADKEQDVEYGSDSSGNEWRIGVGADDDDSEIDSDEAFGESDAERFEDYTFRGSRKKQAESDDNDEELEDADGASLGSDAIDLAQALDMSMSDDDDQPEGEDASSDESGSSDDSDASDASDVSSEDEDMDDDLSESGVNAWVSKFSGVKATDEEAPAATTKPKIGLKELGLLQVKDPQLKKSVKLMGKEQKSSKPQKLAVPLAKRQQDRLDREVARDKTNQTLDRWTETVKQNRRAEHLVFPLPQTETGLARHDNTELQPLNLQSTGNELESTILAIMEESGLGPSAAKEEEMKGPDGEKLTKEERQAIANEKRRLRELKSREEKKAKRIAKIKSKAYHRVHRKQRERDDMKAHEAMVEAGEIDSEEEREVRDRQRAMERMGARHKESKWAKMSNKAGRAAWDEDVRVGIADMARRDEELRRRIEGKSAKATGSDDDDDSDYSADSEDADDRKRLLQKLNSLDQDDDDQPRSALMNMQFMRKAEAARKKANDETIAQIRRELASDGEEGEDSDDGPEEIGRKKYGQQTGKAKPSDNLIKAAKSKNKDAGSALQAARDTIATANSSAVFSAKMGAPTNNVTAGAWSQAATTGPAKKQKGKKVGSSADVLEINADSVAVAPSVPAPKPNKSAIEAKKTAKKGLTGGRGEVSSDDDDDEAHMPVQFREQDLIDRAFGGLDVVADFEAEKAAIAEEDDDKIVDNTLPGWGSWVGDGVSAREKKRHQGRFLVKQEGVKSKDQRKDAKLKDAIINEKRVKKTEKYLATQLPHMFENKAQYERSLRLPVGQEWVTKETFQEATKPRIMVKQGIIAPMAKPTH
ncbi:Utp14 protein-domain-containing protein [Microdochium trichocladiopsis]|uniref:Utp14 protein-domain-containing protein n=1 Tax=Microdochium trichocladiopsis TaxID=1682393 RepID=A0A9P8YH52_9PEZI|nr:Utp14 protein-domain-containing protein [Microdochium trichocladiopsis]KAH7040294.1 Utp14 protein-domain-containing protein [Microdochium trichocladiopsis]